MADKLSVDAVIGHDSSKYYECVNGEEGRKSSLMRSGVRHCFCQQTGSVDSENRRGSDRLFVKDLIMPIKSFVGVVLNPMPEAALLIDRIC